MSKILGDRVIVLIDMDCFFCQVEEKLNPDLKGKPIAVVQYNQWKGGGIIAVNYLARSMGVTRHMRGDEAKAKCPSIQLPQVPCSRGKADTTKYRDAGKEVANVLKSFTSLVERASVDEAYLDITQLVSEEMKQRDEATINTLDILDTHVLGHEDVHYFNDMLKPGSTSFTDSNVDIPHSQKLIIGAFITSRIRAAIFKETGYTASAGIAHNKILAKLVCGMNKPNKQTLLPKHAINSLYNTLDVKKIKSLGGKFGDIVCETLKIKKMSELQRFSEKELQQYFEPKQGTWLFNIARGMDSDPVTPRYIAKSIGCCKNFRGKSAIQCMDLLLSWLTELGKEIEERLENDTLDNNRIPRQMVVSFSQELCPGNDVSSSRSYNFLSSDNLNSSFLTKKALELIEYSTENNFSHDNKDQQKLVHPIKFLGLSIGKFEAIADINKRNSIQDLFNAQKKKLEQAPKNIEAKSKNITNEIVTREHCKSPILSKDSCFNQGNSTKIATLSDQESFFNKYFLQNNSNNSNVPGESTNSTYSCISTSENINFQKEICSTGQQKCIKSICDNVESKEFRINTQYEASASEIQYNRKNTDTDKCPITNELITNDNSDHSNSSIDFEINLSRIGEDFKSPNRQIRIENMRALLNDSLICNIDKIEENNETEEQEDYNIKTVTCSECQDEIPEHELVTHGDYHFALKLIEEEKVSKKAIVKNDEKVVQKKPEGRKDNIKNKAGKSDCLPISVFFSKPNSNIPEDVQTENCKQCGKSIAVQDFLQHLDFHEAHKLHQYINFEQKRKLGLCNKSSKVPRIDNFFK